MNTQPEALRLANELENGYLFPREQIVAELRRLHEANLNLAAMAATANAKNARLYEVNQELVEALQLAIDSHGYLLMSDPPQDAWKSHKVESKARAALAKARGTE